jgi:cytochrome c-type protein NapB
MTAPHDEMPRVGLRVLGIGAGIALMAGVVLLVARLPGRVRGMPDHPAVVAPLTTGEPIASEALVYRLGPTDLAVAATGERRAQAHPRTLAVYRRLRAYPGAPPRIPHGLTAAEYRGSGCGTCHDRGGYAPRFGAYAPTTPHPERSACLQCHLPDADLVPTPLPPPGGETCRQCHVDPDAPAPSWVALDWRTTAWPATGQRVHEESPPLIPHDLEQRGSCLACHGGPSAVIEIRTAHPERSSCRQCHVPAATEPDAFVRPFAGAGANEIGG